MSFRSARYLGPVLWGGLFLAAGAGCGGDASYNRYFPPAEKARQALIDALDSWKAGNKPGHIETGPIPVDVVDSEWQSGKKLMAYEILGEVPVEGPRCFTARLRLENASEEKKVRYIIMGVEPLWVVREDDLDMIAHWECMDPEKAPANSP